MTRPLQRIQHLLELDRNAEALELISARLAEDPDDPDLLGMRARALLGLDRYTEALESGNRMVAVAPDDDWGHRLCAMALDRLGNHAEATHAAQEAVRLTPLDWQNHATYAQVALDARGLGKDATAAADRALQLAPGESDAHFIRGLVAHRLRDDQVARACYQRALALDPEHAMALHNLTLLESRGIRASAWGFGRALRLAPQESVILENVDLLAAAFVRRIYFASLAALLVGLLSSMGGSRSHEDEVATNVIAAILVVGCVAYTWWLARSIPTGIRRYVAPRLVREPLLLALTVLTGAMFVLALALLLVANIGGVIVGDDRILRSILYANVGVIILMAAQARGD